MKLDYTERFLQSLDDAPPYIRAFYKQSRLLHQTYATRLCATKKYDEARNIWQARVTRNWRFYFKIEADTYF
jgi:hypothetical protein